MPRKQFISECPRTRSSNTEKKQFFCTVVNQSFSARLMRETGCSLRGLSQWKACVPTTAGLRYNRNQIPVSTGTGALRGYRKEVMEKITQDSIVGSWLEPCHSEWASPCFIDPKKVAREWQLMVDYCRLNAPTQHDSYTLRLIEDMPAEP